MAKVKVSQIDFLKGLDDMCEYDIVIHDVRDGMITFGFTEPYHNISFTIAHVFGDGDMVTYTSSIINPSYWNVPHSEVIKYAKDFEF